LGEEGNRREEFMYQTKGGRMERGDHFQWRKLEGWAKRKGVESIW